MDNPISWVFLVLFLAWMGAKMLESTVKSAAKTQRKRAEGERDRLYVERVQAANALSRQDLQEFEEWKRQKEERHT